MKVNRKFFLLLVGGLIVQLAVATKNTLEQAKMDKPDIEMAGKGAFVLGWAIVAYSIATPNLISLKSLIAFSGAGAIVATVFYVKEMKKAGKEPNKYIKMLFPAGWILIMMAIIIQKGKNRFLSLLATVLVLASMIVVLPKQRELCIVDGPGMNMFVNAWWLLAISNGVN